MKKVFYLPPFFLFVFSFFFFSSASAVLPFGSAQDKPSDHGLKEGDLISAIFSSDPDVYIVNAHGYKRLFLNPEIFKFYSHLGGFASVKLVTPEVRDAFPTVGLFRNCEKNDLKVYGFESDNEDKGKLRWIDTSGDQAVKDDPDFFKKVFCINDKEFKWYPKGEELRSVKEVPQYHRATPATPATPAIPATPASPSHPFAPVTSVSLPATPASASVSQQAPVAQPATPATPAIPATPAQPASFTPTPTPTLTSSPGPSPTASVSATPTPIPTSISTPTPTSSADLAVVDIVPNPSIPEPGKNFTIDVTVKNIGQKSTLDSLIALTIKNKANGQTVYEIPRKYSISYGATAIINFYTFGGSYSTLNFQAGTYEMRGWINYLGTVDGVNYTSDPNRSNDSITKTLEIKVTPTPTPTTVTLVPPSSVTASLGTGKITVSWSGTTPKHMVYRSVNGGAYQIWYGFITNSYYDDLDGNLANGSSYKYKVYGCDESGYTCSTIGTESNSVTYSGGGLSCIGLTLTLNDGKTTYIKGVDNFVNYTWTCSPGGNASYVGMWLQKPDGSSLLLNGNSGGSTQTLGIGTDNLTSGAHTLKACFDADCATVKASQTFTVSITQSNSKGSSFFGSILKSFSKLFRR